VPVGLAAMQRAIELNGVAVATNQAAFSLGRLAAAEPAACRDLLHQPDPARQRPETVDELIARSVRFLTAYQSARYAARYLRRVESARRAEEAIAGADPSLPFTRAVANQMRKLMAYKDEYEVARLYTDGEFARQLARQFEGRPQLEFYMAPPALVKPKNGAAAVPAKRRFGAWLLPLLGVLARGKLLRGTALDPFGRTDERRLERQLVVDYEARVDELIAGLSADRLAVAVAIAQVPASIRGYGHVKLASLAIARARERELLSRFDPGRYPRPQGAAVAGQFRGIPISSA